MKVTNKEVNFAFGIIYLVLIFLISESLKGLMRFVVDEPHALLVFIDLTSLIIVCVLAYAWWQKYVECPKFSFSVPRYFPRLVFAFILFTLALILAVIHGRVWFYHIVEGMPLEILYPDTPSNNYDTWISIFFLTTCEELMFRGILLAVFLNKYKPGTAIFMSAFIFAIAHITSLADGIDFFHTSFVFILAVLWGFSAYRTGSLLLGILFHIFTTVVLTLGFPRSLWVMLNEKLIASGYFYVVTLLFVAAALLSIYWLVKLLSGYDKSLTARWAGGREVVVAESIPTEE